MIFPKDPLERIHEGMEVVDATGTRLGTVARVQVAIPEQPTHPPDSDLLDDMAQIVPSPPDMTEESNVEAVAVSPFGHDPFELPDLPEPLRDHLRDTGFIEVDGARLSPTQHYIPGDHIQEITNDRLVVRPWSQR